MEAPQILLFSFDVWAQIQSSHETPLIRLEKKKIEVSEQTALKLILAKAPTGLRKFDITVSVRDSRIARISAADKGEAIDRLLFQVREQTEDVIEFRAVSLFEPWTLPATQDVNLAEIKLVGLKEGKTRLDVKVNAFVDDEGQNIAPVVEAGVLEVVAAVSGNVRIGISANAPQDLDQDSLYGHVDSNGKLTLEHLVQFAFNVDSPIVKTQVDHFDFDGDGDVDFNDAVALAKLVKMTPASSKRSMARLFEHSNAVRKAISESGSSLIQQPSGGNQPAGQGGYYEVRDEHYQEEETLFTQAIRLKQDDLGQSFGQEKLDGKITDLTLLCHDPLSVKIEFENTSTTVLNPEGWLEIRDVTGETIKIIPIEAFLTLPGKKTLLACIDGGGGGRLYPGKYLALGIINLGTDCLVAGQRMFVVR